MTPTTTACTLHHMMCHVHCTDLPSLFQLLYYFFCNIPGYITHYMILIEWTRDGLSEEKLLKLAQEPCGSIAHNWI